MNTKTRVGLVAVIILIVIVVFAFMRTHTASAPTTIQNPSATSTVATFACSNGKTITASFVEGASTPATSADQPPTPGGSVALTLSDGRAMTLVRSVSADGARYTNADGPVVFWNKGRGVTFTEGGKQTFMGCIQIANDPGTLPSVYESGTKGFSLRYPAGYTIDEKYSYQAQGPGRSIGGVKFTIPSAAAANTNLSSDSYMSVEEIPNAKSCSASAFVQPGAKVTTITEGDTTYSVASTSDAAAGNRYDETVYAFPGTSPCMAVRYFIHYGAIENYPPDTAHAFDRQALLAQFDAMRRSLIILQ